MSDFSINMDKNVNSMSFLNSKLENLKNASNGIAGKNLSPEEKKKIEQTSRSFESMFVNMMMKQMKQSMLDEDENKEEGEMSFGADTLKGYSDMLFGDYVSKSGKGIGIGEMIYKHLTGEDNFPTITNEIKPLDLSNLNLKNNQDEDLIGDYLNQNIKIPEIKTSPNPAVAVNQKALERISNYDKIISTASSNYKVPENLIKAIITVESAGKNEAKSGAGAKGLMQLMDGTAQDMGVKNAYDPKQNIMGGTKYISNMLEKYDNNLDKALAAYNAGPGNVDKYNGVPPFKETQAYVQKVKHYLYHYSKNDLNYAKAI